MDAMTGPPLWFVATTFQSSADRFDIVAVGIDQECREIGRAVVGARTRPAVVPAARLHARCVEVLDRGVVGRAESDMRSGAVGALVQIKPERGFALRPESRAVLILRARHIAQRR